jgi:hypothetical protein
LRWYVRENFVEELLEERMPKTLIFAAAAGLAVGLGAFGANAMTSTSPAGLRVATEAMDNSALVHCRPYRHPHPWGFGFGCGGGGSSVEIRRGHHGVGIEERERSSIHSRTTTRGETSVRGSTRTTTGESTKSGTSTTSKSGTSPGGSTGRAQTGEKSSGGVSSGGGMSGSSGGTTGGQSGQKQ